MPLPRSRMTRTRGRARRHLDGQDGPVECRHVDLAAEDRFGKRDGNAQDDVVPLTAEMGVRLDVQSQMKIGARGALPLQAENLPFLDARGNFDGKLVIVEVKIDGAAESRGQEGNRHIGSDGFLRTRLGPARSATRPLAKDIAEVGAPLAAHARHDISQYLLRLRIDLRSAGAASSPVKGPSARSAAEAWLRAGKSVAVVLFAFGLVAENIVGVLDLLELRLGLLVARIAVRVMLPGQTAIGLLDVLWRRCCV